MRPLVLLWGCLVLPGYEALEGPKEVSGFEGDTVSLQCTYGVELKKYRKYWCRESGFLISRCSGTVYAGEYGQEGRVSVHDNPRQLRFEVTLRNLTLKDVGQYWCGAKRVGFDKTFSVSLLVFPASAGLHLTVTTAKLGKTGAEVSPFTGTSPSKSAATSPYAGTSPHPATSPFARTSSHPATSPYAGTSPYARTSPYAATLPNAGTSPHPATSPPAGISRQATRLDSTSTEDTSFVPIRSSSKTSLLPSCPQGVRPNDPHVGPSPGAAGPSAGHRPGRPRQLHAPMEEESSTGHGDTEEGEGPSLPLATGEQRGPRVCRDRPCRAHWASCQPQRGDPVPEPDFKGRRSLVADP
ncbi:CMRF35-like molecule 9 isoform X2 [Pseudorca crassidens]|uniref:CMRF35-like molecule 9 isoform X2 n=1 Tax=Pseudorca crassidens TaxID=82174 RepID=UPI00352E453C